METWEYFTTTFVADTRRTQAPLIDEVPSGNLPRYSIYTLIPQLNQFGSRGWELVSLEPIQEGNNGDVRACDASSGQWTYTYLAAFKRRTTGAPPPPPVG